MPVSFGDYWRNPKGPERAVIPFPSGPNVLVLNYCIVEARNLEHDYPRALKVKYKGSWH